jgi:hypothetical protein
VNLTNEEIIMKSFNKVLLVTTLMFGTSAVMADPVSDLTAIAAVQIAEQAAEMKANLAEQLKQSLTESLVEAVSKDAESTDTEVLAGLATTESAIVE